eukprot:scaffold36311_cov32-Phaeocystis_antarctica.AAC.1
MGAFHPALCPGSASARKQRCLVLGRCTLRTWFLSWEMAFGVPNSPFSPAARAGYIASAS